MLAGLLRRREARKLAKNALRLAKHVRNHREDVAKEAHLENLAQKEAELRTILRGKADTSEITEASANMVEAVSLVASKRRFSGLRENLEILVVAIAVAMGIRTYFIQPFKIPTGSMQPTLYGIHGIEMDAPALTDKFPLKPLRWIITGEWYKEVRVRQTGRLRFRQPSAKPGLMECHVGNYVYFVPKSDRLLLMEGIQLTTGAVLWRGRQKAGDHVFVNKVAWNFVKPRRGDVMVFNTRDIVGLPEGTHYIKRMCGMPSESVGVNPPHVLIGMEPLMEPETIRRVAESDPGYHGYQLARAGGDIDPVLKSADARIHLAKDEYVALGDNTRSSYDSRYWGSVPRDNLVGPAFLLYWPYSQGRWGFIKGH